MHKQSFKSLSWLHIHSSPILHPLFPPKLFILSILYVFFTSCHSWKRRNTSCTYSSPCFHPPGAAHFPPPLLPFDSTAGRCGVPPPSQMEEFHTRHIKVEIRSGQVHTQIVAEGSKGVMDHDQPRKSTRSYFSSSPTCIVLQIKITLQQKTTSHLNYVRLPHLCTTPSLTAPC